MPLSLSQTIAPAIKGVTSAPREVKSAPFVNVSRSRVVLAMAAMAYRLQGLPRVLWLRRGDSQERLEGLASHRRPGELAVAPPLVLRLRE